MPRSKRRRSSLRAEAETWARTVRPTTGGVRCYVCSAPPEVAEFVLTVARLKAKRRSRATLPALSRELSLRFGVAIRDHSLFNHVTACLGMPWGRG